MTRKVYRSAMGRTVDLGALQLQNENIRAVGNMNVNARGDLIDGWNRPINSRNQQVSKQYNRQTRSSNVTDEPITASSSVVAAPRKVKKNKSPKAVAPEVLPIAAEAPTKVELKAGEASGGLAAAIARARQVRQEPMLGQKESTKNNPGVSKI